MAANERASTRTGTRVVFAFIGVYSRLLLVSSVLCGAESADWIVHLGGKAERNTAGQLVAVDLRGSWINDAEMIELARLPQLERLDLSHTRITDEGMLHLKSAPKINELNLF